MKNDNSIPEMVTINMAADRTGCSRHFVRKLCVENRIVNIRTGSKYLINFQKFCDFLNGDADGGDQD